ncbi:MAG TPA: response regulator [Candidatus Saccharimonadales bacterium]|nr:response regulator [Candidatus Saccharimonadales bacterium]
MTKVLVVDDHEDIRNTLTMALDDEGYEVRAAANGLDALSVLDEWTPNVILLDLMMPVMDGWAFRKEQLRRHDGKAAPVVILSAAGELETHRATLSAAAFIPKPFEIDRVVETIAAVS